MSLPFLPTGCPGLSVLPNAFVLFLEPYCGLGGVQQCIPICIQKLEAGAFEKLAYCCFGTQIDWNTRQTACLYPPPA